MKNLKDIIIEKLKINSKSKVETKYHPKDKDELKKLINQLIEERGNEADLNDIDTSKITDMTYLFWLSIFNGDISNWDVSNVLNMGCMFLNSKFTGKHSDISKWDVSNVKYMGSMFSGSKFEGDISEWNISKVKTWPDMFSDSPLEKNPPKWYHE